METIRQTALVTGACGFAGMHLVKRLARASDLDVWTTDRRPLDASSAGLNPDRHRLANLLEPEQVSHLIQQVRPVQIYHLAGQAFVGASWKDPWGTIEANVRAQLNLMDAVLKAGLKPRFLVVGSMEVYGNVAPSRLPVDEDHPLRPVNPYGASKATQEMLALQYCRAYGLPVVCVRPFNHIGPGQAPSFVAPAFASQIAAIESGRQAPIIKVGSLAARRDFTDVRDVVNAYALVLARGEAGGVYNIGSGVSHSIQTLLDTLLQMTSAEIKVETDPDRLRPVDVPDIVADVRRLVAHTGWRPEISLERSLRDVLDDARRREREHR